MLDIIPWWTWPIILFGVTFAIGIVAVLGGVGGGVIFVPIMSGFFPFHLDFVRSAGLLVALASSLSASPILLRKHLAHLKLAMPMALFASIGGIFGAILGLALPTNVVQISLGVTILVIVIIMLRAKKSEYPEVKKVDRLSTILGIKGTYHEESTKEVINWQVHKTPQAMAIYIIVGLISGMFGLGAGWANVPVLNLIMGVPLKIAVSTSNFLISITSISASWIYINRGAVLPILVIPSVIGMMLGARIGAILLPKVRTRAIRYIVIGVMLFSGARALLKGLGF